MHLSRSDEWVAEVDALVSRLGGRVGLRGVLADLNRRARAVRVPAPAALHGFRWDREDMHSPRWWPQGITTSADSLTGDADGLVDGRPILVTSSYSYSIDGYSQGSRLSFVDLTDPSHIRYRHVLLVEPFLRDDGSVDVRPVMVHAGGIVWHGDYLHVSGTTRGLSSFRLDDIVRVPTGDASRLRVRDASPATVDTYGYRYVLPVRFTYDSHTRGLPKMRYSFASLDRSTSPHGLVAGEYGREGMTTRLARYEIDRGTRLLRVDDEGVCRPALLEDGGVPGMQGATVVRGTWYVTTSRGRFRLGSVWVGKPGDLVEHRHELPVGPEDITYWPERDQLWSLSEYPKARYVFAMARHRFD